MEDKIQQLKEVDKDLDENEMYNKIVEQEKERKALYLAACEAGIMVTEEEIDEIIKKVQMALSESPETKSQLDAFVEGASMSQEEYWEEVRDVYKRNLMIQKFLDMMTEEVDMGEIEDESDLQKIEDESKVIQEIIEEKEKEFNVSVE